jgi:glycosyltransferase involved in cell wall biosynthesis
MITYNHESYIIQAIDGVLNQLCDCKVELILANDCSPDNTDHVVKYYLANHPNKDWVKYTRHQKNKGMMENFIWAMEQCTGNYIAICEGDDYWTDPLKLQKQLDVIKNEIRIGMVYTDCQFNEGEKLVQCNFKFGNFNNLDSFFLKKIPFLNTSSWLIDKKYIEKFKPIGRYPDLPGDAQLVCYILAKGGQIVQIKEQTGVYRVLEESASHSKTINKNIGFLQLKYALFSLYKNKLSKEVIEFFKLEMIKQNFHNFKSLNLTFVERFLLLSSITKSKGIKRAYRFLLTNNV